MGGDSSEREISLRSGKAIAGALRRGGIEVIEIGEKEPVEEGVIAHSFDRAFIALHGRKGEDGQIQAFLEKQGIPYTGSGVAASRLAMDKVASKKKCIEMQFLTPHFEVFCVKIGQVPEVQQFPVIVKPSREGSSYGLEVVQNEAELKKAVENASAFDSEVLIEKHIAGREITVGILGETALPPVEIRPKSGLYDFYSKYTTGATQYLVPAPIETSLTTKIQDIALKIFRLFDCRDFSRVDFILDREGDPYFLEVNTIPGFTETSLLPKAAHAAGIGFDALCLKILECAFNRCEQKTAS